MVGGAAAFDFAGALAAARAGDPAGVAWLWRANNAALLRYLRGRGAGARAEDLAATTWIDAAAGLRGFEGDEASFRRWLFTIARRRLVDDLRRSGRRPEVLVGEAPVRAGEDDPAATAVHRDELARALTLVRRLPPDQADAVLLRVVADLDVADVARILDKTPGAVRVLTHRGLRRLAELVEREAGVTDRSAPTMDGLG